MAIIIVSHFLINRSVKTNFTGKTIQRNIKRKTKYNLYNTDHLFRLWWTKSTKVLSLPFPGQTSHIPALEIWWDQHRLQWVSWQQFNCLDNNSTNSSIQFNCVLFAHKKDPDSYLIHVCLITIVVPDCSILHICLHFELSIKKCNILKTQISHPLQSSLISSDRISITCFNTWSKNLPMASNSTYLSKSFSSFKLFLLSNSKQ